MTVSSATSDVTYDGNGSTQIFSVPFYFLDDTHLVVQTVTAGVSSTKTLNTDYTVSGAGNEAGGEVTFLSAPATGTKVYIYRQVPLTQLVSYVENTPFPAVTQEEALDQLTMAAQQLYLAIQGALRLSAASTIDGVSGVLPEPLANAALGWNNSGTGFVNVTLADQGTGAYSPGFTGAVASRLIADKLRESVSVEDFGAAGDGVTDDAAAIQAAIDYLASANGGVLNFAAKTYAIGSTLLISTDNVFLRGRGSNMPVDSGTGASQATELLWTSASASTIVNFETPTGTGNAKRSGGGASGIYLKGNGVASIGLRVCSWAKGYFGDLHVSGVTTAAYKSTCWSSTQLSEAADTQYCVWDRCSWRLIQTAAEQSADGLVITSEAPGTSTADSSLNQFRDCMGQTYNGHGIRLADADNNILVNCRPLIVTGTGKSFRIEGGYSNTFIGCPIGSKTAILGTASGAFRNSTLNVFFSSDDANSTGSPSVDAGCTYQWHGTKYGWQGLISSQAVFGSSRAAALSASSGLGTETIRVSNSSQDHIHLTDGTNEWSLRIDGSGNLQAVRIAGTGTFIIPGAFNAHADAAITGYMAVTDGTGTARKLAVIA